MEIFGPEFLLKPFCCFLLSGVTDSDTNQYRDGTTQWV